MKRGILAILLLVLLTVSVAADSLPTDQIIELRDENGALTMVTTQPPTFWEAPDLKSGETVTVTGKLTLVNATLRERDMTLKMVELPFDNQQALEYLNHLQLTIQTEEGILYNDLYSRVNDGGDPLIRVTLKPGEAVSYTLSLKCDYTYAGTEGLGDAILNWQFVTPLTDETVSEEPAVAFSDPLLKEVLAAAVITAVVLAALYLYRRSRL